MSDINTVWNLCLKKRPEVDKKILIMTSAGGIIVGYMSSRVFTGENNPTFAFHGLYYDFNRNEKVYCLVNALAWTNLPEELTFMRLTEEETKLREQLTQTGGKGE